MAFSLDARAHSEVGPVRKNNQDSAYISGSMLLVADGMGGAAAGDLASTVAVQQAAKADGRYQGEDMLEAAAGAMTRANDTLADLIVADPRLDGMGTTVSGALFSGTQLGMVHIGDSRGYLLRDGKLTRITHDHSWVQALVDEGKISEEEAAVHPHRNLLLRVLNGQPIHEPDYWLLDVREGDRLMLCSDGLCGLVDDELIGAIMGARPVAEPGPAQDSADASDAPTVEETLPILPSLDEAMGDLVDAARDAGGHDNITVILADVVAQSDALDAAAPLVLGAAATVTVPSVPEVGRSDDAPEASVPTPDPEDLDPESPPPGLIDPDAGERERYAPTQSRRRLILPLVSTLLAIILLALGAWGGLRWTKTQYYVGARNDVVTIFRGLPGAFLGLRLQEPYEAQTTQVDDLPTYYANEVRAGMTPGTLENARSTAAVLDAKAAVCIAKREARQRQITSPAPSASPSASATGAPKSGAPSASSAPSGPAGAPNTPPSPGLTSLMTSGSSSTSPSIEDEGC